PLLRAGAGDREARVRLLEGVGSMSTQTREHAHLPPAGPPTGGMPTRNADARRRRLARGFMVAAALLYVLILLLAPLGGIIYYGLKSGAREIGRTFTLPDVRHAFYLTIVIMLV